MKRKIVCLVTVATGRREEEVTAQPKSGLGFASRMTLLVRTGDREERSRNLGLDDKSG